MVEIVYENRRCLERLNISNFSLDYKLNQEQIRVCIKIGELLSKCKTKVFFITRNGLAGVARCYRGRNVNFVLIAWATDYEDARDENVKICQFLQQLCLSLDVEMKRYTLAKKNCQRCSYAN